MDAGKIKNQFVDYLLQLQEKNPNNKKYEDVDYSNVNIFSFQKEFKDYIDDNYQSDNCIKSMSINDILKMEIDETGKLVTEEDLAAYDQANEDAENGEMPEEDDNNLVTGMVNVMMQNEDFISTFDADGSQDINEEELGNFLNLANNIDGDNANLTVDDLMGSIEEIANGGDLSKYATENTENPAEGTEQNEEKEEDKTAEELANSLTDTMNTVGDVAGQLVNTMGELANTAMNEGQNAINQATEAAQQAQGQQAQGQQSNGGTPTGGTGSGIKQTTPNGNTSANGKDLENMSLDELKSEKTKADGDLSKEQKELSEIKDGTNSELKGLKEDEEKAYEEYQKLLEEKEPELAKQLDEFKNKISEKDQQIGQKENEISQKDGEISEAETAIANAEGKIASLNTQKAALEAKLAVAPPAQKAAITAQITGIEAEIAEAEAEKEAAEGRKETAEAQKEALQTELNTLQSEKIDLESQMQSLEQEIAKLSPEINKAMNDYKEAQREYDTRERELTTEAQKSVDDAQKYVNDIAKEISERETKNILNKYPVDDYNAVAGEKLADAAKNSKWGKTTKGQKRCATGVADIFNGVYGTNYHGNGCDWDTNMEDMVDKGYFKEVTSDYPSASDLSNLPAGAVVCWEATTGKGNGGARYGHVAIADGNGGEISDHYAPNIYKEIGGRSDNYKVYIPIK